MSGKRDLYDILGVPKDASEQDIKKAFRALAKELHPDVVGDDAARVARFKEVAAAYETLSDVDKRAAYDRAQTRRASGGPRVWPGGFHPPPGGPSRPPPPPRNDLDLEDLFTDFSTGDFGFGNRRNRKEETRPGRDVAVTVDVPPDVAGRGGTVTVHYQRLRRVDGGLTLVRGEELHELRVPPGTRTGDTLRVPRLGDAGELGGAYGDLVVDVRVRGEARAEPPRGDGTPTAGWPGSDDPGPRMRMKPESGDAVVVVDVTIAEAVLGGRVTVPTPSGAVKIAIPAGTNSGAKFRLRGKGPAGPSGPRDLVAELRIVVPRELDEESRRLIERFAELNPRVD